VKRTATIVAVLAMLCAASSSAFAADEAADLSDKAPGAYLVIMDEEPVVAYTGGLPGLEATAVSADDALDPRSPTVAAYVDHLRSRHDDALRAAGIPLDTKLYDYTFATNGFAAGLTASQAHDLESQAGVRAVVRDELRTPATDSTPDFLGLTDSRGPWATGYTGDGVVIGVIDTGIWPEHASFTDTGIVTSPPADFTATACDFGSAVPGAVAHNGDDADFPCGGKIVAAQAFSAGFTAAPARAIAATDYLSARDADGHGSHTAAIAGGAQRVVAEIGQSGPVEVSGVAPRAQIAAYKACWTDDTGGVGCVLSDLVAAIDQAVADGVDVISYAVGSNAATLGPDDLAFMYATAAGVLVAAPAGNGGPDAASIHSPGTVPWVTTVAAASDDRAFLGTVTLGDGTTVEGASTSAGTPELPVVDAAQLGNPTCDPAGSFAEAATGAIVLCAGSALTPAAVTSAVADQGGAAAIVADLSGSRTVVAGRTVLPLISVDEVSASRVALFIAESGGAAVATLGRGIPTEVTGSIIAPFSARGPNPLVPDILKPDVTAPGVAIVAATSTDGGAAETFATHSGTSAAAAHVAGVYALLRQAHPTWSASAVKSALVTTTRRDVWTDGELTPADALSAGSGLIQPGGAITRRGTPFNPGLVYETALADDVGFVCGLGLIGLSNAAACRVPAVAAADLNLPSIGLAGAVGTATVTRTVTSVADRTRVFEARIDAPPGFFVEVDPARLTLAPGESAQFELRITPTRAPSGEWRQGSLTWVSDDYRVTSPIVAQAAALAAPVDVAGSGTSGSAGFGVTFGYGGEYTAAAYGLVAPTVTAGTVTADPAGDVRAAMESGEGVATFRVVVAEGEVLARFALVGGSDDLDLYVFAEDDRLVGRSVNRGSGERIDLASPAAGAYTIVVHGSDVVGPEADFTLSEWVVGGDPAARLDVVRSPDQAVENAGGFVSVAWREATQGAEMVGAVTHGSAERIIAVTAITVNTTSPTESGPLAVANR
jgi:subtilisin family serine protease